MRRGRRHPDDLRIGDAVDFFRVEALVPDRLLRLRAEMKVPGDAWLEWTMEQTDEGTVLVQKARFQPRGVAGRLYWYTMLPFHHTIFRELAHRLAAGPDTGSGSGAGTGSKSARNGQAVADRRAVHAS
jgi:hypothetical protein